ncbi:hypothetical protein [Vibrio anguillarum]|uniref:hypothetical protein n=1 Tax=Vibrio anguillarum TaxID=55601 RepID=UPI0012FDDB86|nr:hypothetical protein [Vibrio anguillarum]
MLKTKHLAVLISSVLAANSYALNILPDPENSAGYIVSKVELQGKRVINPAF